MVNFIEITIKSGIREILSSRILFNDNICIMNNNKYKIDDDFKNKILSIICLWKNEYGYDNNIDSEEFTITVDSIDGKDIFHGKGIFPDNYNYLIRMLGDLHDK